MLLCRNYFVPFILFCLSGLNNLSFAFPGSVQEIVIFDFVFKLYFGELESSPRSERMLKNLLNIIPDLRKGFVLDAWAERAKAIYDEHGKEYHPVLSRMGEKAGDANDLESKETVAGDEVGEHDI
jgi:hypothetical protein